MARWASIRCPHCKERIQLYTIHQVKVFKQWRRRESGAPKGRSTTAGVVASGATEEAAANPPPLLGSVGTALRARKTRSSRGGP